MLVRARIEDDRWVATHASEPDPRDERRRCWIVASDTVGARCTRARFGLFVGRLRGPLVGGRPARRRTRSGNWCSRVAMRVSRSCLDREALDSDPQHRRLEDTKNL
jgi:hypothetical protein